MPLAKLFDGYNAGYVQELYERFARDPASVEPEWRRIFQRKGEELEAAGLIVPDALTESGGIPRNARIAGSPAPTRQSDGLPTASAPKELLDATGPATRDDIVGGPGGGRPDAALVSRVAKAAALVHALRDHGHQLARIDPLGSDPPGHPRLDPAVLGTSLDDLDAIPTSLVLEGGGDRPLSETIRHLLHTYGGSIGYQFEHLEDPDKVRWLWKEVESGRNDPPMDPKEKVRLLRRLSQVEGFERFLHRAYLGHKRFSIEGTDMLVPMLDAAIEAAAAAGGREVVLGMAHRGRLNVLAHIVGVEYTSLLKEFEGGAEAPGRAAAAPGTGDVKYHYGARGVYETANGSTVRVTLSPNPSHLEFVDPVVGGIARALQHTGSGRDDPPDSASVVPILMHGDAAFAAQGVVAESLNLARLRGFGVGGTVHVIVNNQIGFTTEPADGRSTRYASDLAKGYDIPVVHVNGDDPQACLAAARLAMAYRERFRDDVLIDLIGYRRHGHNEGDEPAYTQPLLYGAIEGHPTVRERWADHLVADGVLTGADVDRMEHEVAAALREAQERARSQASPAGTRSTEDEPTAPAAAAEVDSAVPIERLVRLNEASLTTPAGFKIHPKLVRQMEARRTEFDEDTTIDWAHAEALAFASLLEEGVPIRLSGQDTQRGTFSQRHFVLHDAETGKEAMPLATVGKARFGAYNSPLSEAAVLAFEYGYSVVAGTDLVLWEAQFGDFVNAAQVIVDQFIASGRAKWGQLSRLTLLLPHGYEGQGPEHSSARLERFLQICAEDNIRVCYPSTPAQYFHLLRRQAIAAPARPLIAMTPKSLLRLPIARSSARELSGGGFQPVLAEPGSNEITRLVLCSGKVYYDLTSYESRSSADRDHQGLVSIARVEELYPFPARDIRELVSRYPSIEEVVWVQEEPRNMGALSYIGPHLRGTVPREIPLRHVSRPERASPAEGRPGKHAAWQERIVREALLGTDG